MDKDWLWDDDREREERDSDEYWERLFEQEPQAHLIPADEVW